MSDLEVYEKQRFGQPTGFGGKPALLVVDFVNGFVDPDVFGGGNIAAAVERTVPVLAAARRAGLPIAFTRVIYAEDGSDCGVWCEKVPGLRALTASNPHAHVVDALAPRAGELVVDKQQASAFFATGLGPWLIGQGVDTLVVAGCTTSGCVRATVVDAMSLNYRPIVVTDCVGDRALGPHEANLFDMGQKYADLMDQGAVLDRLSAMPGSNR